MNFLQKRLPGRESELRKDEWQKRGAGHRARLREKFLNHGISAMSDEEIVELLLSFGTPRADCKPAARELLRRFGSMAAVLDAETDALRETKGVGEKNVFGLRFIPDVAKRYLQRKIERKNVVHNSQDVKAYLSATLASLKREVFLVIYLDSQHHILDSKVLCEGTINVNTVYPREVVTSALRRNAAAIIIAHNHPSGSLQRSVQDDRLTKTLYLACNMMHIRLLDHLIVGEDVYSYADNGIMQQIAAAAESEAKMSS